MQGKEDTMLDTVSKGIAIFVLLAVMVVIGFLVLLGDAGWLILVGLVLLATGGALYQWRLNSKIKVSTYICLLLVAVNILVGLTLYIGASPRPLTRQERRDVLTYLELQYPDQNFRILSGRARHSIDGWGILQFGTFRWNEIEAIVEDGDGLRFEVTGNQQWWRVRVGSFYFSDNRPLMQPQFTNQDIQNMKDQVWEIIVAHDHLFYGSTISRRHERISLAPQYIEAYITITFNHITEDDFDRDATMEKMRIVRDEISTSMGFESVAVNVRFNFRSEHEEPLFPRAPTKWELILMFTDTISYNPSTGLLQFVIPEFPIPEWARYTFPDDTQQYTLMYLYILSDDWDDPIRVYERGTENLSWQPGAIYSHQFEPYVLEEIRIYIGVIPFPESIADREYLWSHYTLAVATIDKNGDVDVRDYWRERP